MKKSKSKETLSGNAKPERSYRKVLGSLYQVLKINQNIEHPFWQAGQAALQGLPSQQVRIGVWNIFKGNGGIRFLHDFRRFVYDLDLVLIQEALVGQHSFEEYCLDGWQVVHCASYERMDGLRDGVMTMSRWPVVDEPQRIRSRYVEPLLKTPKVALVTRYCLPCGESLQVVNIHATLIRSRERALEEMNHLMSELPSHRGPLIIGGDFNTFRRSYFEGVTSCLGQLGLEPVAVRRDPRRRAHEQLDHIFMRGFLAERIRVVGELRSSDHLPLRATLVY